VEILLSLEKLEGRVLDFGCGYGFDADHFGWDGFDPYYRNVPLCGPYDHIVCNYVLNALTRRNREKAISQIRDLLADDGLAFLAVARDLPVTGELGLHHSLQNYVVLTLPSIYADDQVEIYKMDKTSKFEDKTKDYLSRRDRRRDR
jgi:SAM-dependent methyltransferase